MYMSASSCRTLPGRFSLLLARAALFLATALGCGVGTAIAADSVIISEFMANNLRNLADEDGNYSDWIELHNTGPTGVSLNGWYLTDTPSSLQKWQFPAISIPGDGYLVVFASGKNRAPLFGELHTNFKLSNKTGYIGLVASNGTTVVSEFVGYPSQIPNLSYGIPVQNNLVTLVATNAPAQVLVPKDGSLGTGWTEPEFNPAGWAPAVNGIGYETDVLTTVTPVLLGDSVKDYSSTGTQGQNNWFYGYWDQAKDADGVYAAAEFVPFPRSPGVANPANFYTNGVWHWFPSADASTELNRFGGVAAGDNGSPGGVSHWAIRRWVSKTNGLVRITGLVGDRASCTDGSHGDGIVARIFVDGVEVYHQAVRETSLGYSLVTTVAKDSNVDFAIDPGPGRNDDCDSAAFTAVINSTAPSLQLLADSMADWSPSGEQGQGNWFYGFSDRGGDLTPGYQAADFTPFSEIFWNGVEYVWPVGTPPYDEVGQQSVHPNSPGAAGGEHWMIRRWVSQVSGSLIVDWHFGKAVSGGSGATARIFLKASGAAAAPKATALITGTNVFGTNLITTITGVQQGDALDFVFDAGGVAGVSDDVGDSLLFDARIFGPASLTPFVATDLRSSLQGVNSSAFIRFPFDVADPSPFETLDLALRYDSGFVAYLNGTEVLRRNAPQSVDWNSSATVERPDADAGTFASFDLRNFKDFLRHGPNVLAFQAMNSSATDSDMLLQARLTAGYGTFDPTAQRYFSTPTPGGPNGLGNTNLGPVIYNTQHQPNTPKPGQPLLVTAEVLPSFNPVANVQLTYQVMYGARSNVVMFDDGLHGDGLAGDGVYGATIPETVYVAGNMVRYQVHAWDVKTNETHDPPFVKGQRAPEFWGTVVEDASLTNPTPVFHWFTATPAAATDGGGTGSIFYNGQFLDNVAFTLHGQSSLGFPKHSFNVNLNPGYKLVWSPNAPAIHDINLMTTYPDKAHMRNILAYNSYKDAGTPYHFVFPIRVQQNGLFWGDAHFMENGDNTYLERLGLDPNGALYKMYDTFSGPAPSGIEKKTRKNEGNNDIAAFYNGVTQQGKPFLNYIYDNLNLPEVINYLATMIITANTDCCHKNYYFYRDSDGTGEWQMLPWDQDLSFGRVWSGAGAAYFDDTIYSDTAIDVGDNNTLVANLRGVPVFKQMFLRRLRTLMEELLQAPGTPANLLKYEREVDQLVGPIAPDAALDLVKWGTWSGNASSGNAGDASNIQSVQEAANLIKYQFLPGRRHYLFDNKNLGIPAAQPAVPALAFGPMEVNPASGNQDEEYFTITNTTSAMIDVSHWRITGAVDFAFQGGTVIPTNGTLYVSPNVKAFRARASFPTGGQGLFVQGGYKGHLSARGEGIQLVDRTGQVIAQTNYPAAPSAAQQSLRITELMYHPAPAPAGSPYLPDDFEYVELRNVGATPLDLKGVRFTNGIGYDFTGSAIPSLAPGQRVLVVRSIAAFTSRYGTGLPIAGEYAGALNNGGEALRLEDATGEVILDFSFNNSWYPVTDGLGFSLVIRDELAPWDAWGLAASWRPSGSDAGSPGGVDPAPRASVPVVINEVLAHSANAGGDAIELRNPAPSVAAIGGWYLSDDFANPTKYRLPAGLTLAAGGILTIPESLFNAGGAGSFALGAAGDEAYLFAADPVSGRLTGYYSGYKFGASFDGMTFGPETTSLGETWFVRQARATLGQPNSGAAVGPLVLAEVMYHPVDKSPGNEPSKLEYIEVANVTAAAVPLFDPQYPTNSWRIAGGVHFSFPAGASIPAQGAVLVVGFDPATNPEALAEFVTHYSVPAGTPVFGPYSGQLNNSGDTLLLEQPDIPDPVTKGVSHVLMDSVHYATSAPWPGLADGFGPSLHRKPLLSFGEDPAHWIAARPSPGSADADGASPAITQGPQGGNPAVGSDLTLSVAAQGASPLAYQWVLDGQPIPGATASSLALQDIHMLQWGNYQVVVMNPDGAVLSDLAPVVVQESVVFLKQPASKNLVVGTNFVLSVTALGNGPLKYQWLYNDQEIPGATANTNRLVGVTTASEGVYRVRVSDSLTTRLTAPAVITVYDRPRIVAQPQPIALLSGEDATFGVVAAGRGPLNFQWRRAGSPKTNFFGFQTVSYFTVKSVTQALAGAYSVMISNLAGASTTSVQVALTILADADNDRMADVWETAHGLDPANPADALLDSDHDGVSNLDEYRADTDPNDATSYLKIDRLSLSADATLLEFFARSNRSYTLEFREAVDMGAWQTLTNVLVQTNSRVERVVDPYPVSSGRIYRLASPALIDRAVRTPVVLESPEPATVFRGSQVSLSVFAYGTGGLRFQWKRDGREIPGATQARLSFSSVQPGDQADYSVVVTDDTGSVTSGAARLVVLDPPVIQVPPAGASAHAGSPVQFTVGATGNAPLTYHWLFNHEPIAGAHGATLLLPKITAANAGTYQVLVGHQTSNGLVSVRSEEVELVVLP